MLKKFYGVHQPIVFWERLRPAGDRKQNAESSGLEWAQAQREIFCTIMTSASKQRQAEQVAGQSLGSENASECHSAFPVDQSPELQMNEKHFATDHLRVNLRQRTISSSVVTFGAQGAIFAINLGTVMILARMLTPHDFGLLAMVMTLMGVLRIFKDAGLSTPTIQREGITHAQVSNLFWINFGLSSFIGLLFALSAPAISWFYKEPHLVGITVVLSFTFILEGSVTQPQAILSRQMRFGLLAWIGIASMLAGSAVGISMAWKACGYWSLVGLQLTTPAVAFILTWIGSSWHPQFPTKDTETRSLVTFGANLAVSNLIWTLARNADGVLIGSFFGSNALGLYSRASLLLYRPIEQLLIPIQSVFLPMVCRIQSEPERYRRVALQVFEAVALMSFIVAGLLLALARPLTLVLLGPKWEEAVPIFSGFAIGSVFIPLSCASSWLFVSQGRSKDSLITYSTLSILAICSMLAGMPFGPAGVAYAYSISAVLIFLPIMFYFVGKQGPISTEDLWGATLRHLPAWGIVCGTAWGIQSAFGSVRPLEQLTICAPVALAVGFVFIWIYAPSREVAMLLWMALKRRSERA